MGFREENHRSAILIISYERYMLSARLTTLDADLDHLAEAALSNFSTIKSFLFLSFSQCIIY